MLLRSLRSSSHKPQSTVLTTRGKRRAGNRGDGDHGVQGRPLKRILGILKCYARPITATRSLPRKIHRDRYSSRDPARAKMAYQTLLTLLFQSTCPTCDACCDPGPFPSSLFARYHLRNSDRCWLARTATSMGEHEHLRRSWLPRCAESMLLIRCRNLLEIRPPPAIAMISLFSVLALTQSPMRRGRGATLGQGSRWSATSTASLDRETSREARASVPPSEQQCKVYMHTLFTAC